MAHKTIIGIAGPTASGKTTVAAELAETHGAYRTRYSEILADIARKEDRPTDKATLQQLYLEGRAKHGEDFLAKLLEKKVAGVDEEMVIVEGNRRLVDIDLLERLGKTSGTTLKLLYVDASRERRYARYNRRQVEERRKPISWDEFIELESNPAEDELGLVRDIVSKHGTILRTDELNRDEVGPEAASLLKLE